MALKLYQFAISHYCEKIRWALEYKGLNYETVNLLPGQHVKTIRKLTGQASSVPVLEHDGQVVQGSAAILDYLDQAFPEHSLTPEVDHEHVYLRNKYYDVYLHLVVVVNGLHHVMNEMMVIY